MRGRCCASSRARRATEFRERERFRSRGRGQMPADDVTGWPRVPWAEPGGASHRSGQMTGTLLPRLRRGVSCICCVTTCPPAARHFSPKKRKKSLHVGYELDIRILMELDYASPYRIYMHCPAAASSIDFPFEHPDRTIRFFKFVWCFFRFSTSHGIHVHVL
jgi:hypothetical protein